MRSGLATGYGDLKDRVVVWCSDEAGQWEGRIAQVRGIETAEPNISLPRRAANTVICP